MIIDHINTIIARMKPGPGNGVQKLLDIDISLENYKTRLAKLLCGRFSSAWNKYLNEYVEIWRGVKSYDYGDIVVVSPGTRISQNVNNLYTRLLSDILPDWKDYPKRSQSFICTNSKNLSSFYGNSYLVFPENGAKIGICPRADIWDSFRLTLNHPSIPEFVAEIRAILSIANEKSLESINNLLVDGTVEEILLAMDRATEFLHTPVNITSIYDIRMKDEFINNKNLTLLDYIQKQLDPIKNGFVSTTIEQLTLSQTKEHEIWTDATCLMIDKESVSRLNKVGLKMTC